MKRIHLKQQPPEIHGMIAEHMAAHGHNNMEDTVTCLIKHGMKRLGSTDTYIRSYEPIGLAGTNYQNIITIQDDITIDGGLDEQTRKIKIILEATEWEAHASRHTRESPTITVVKFFPLKVKICPMNE